MGSASPLATRRRPIGLWLRRAVVVGQALLVLLVFGNWLYVTTYRLYLENRADRAEQTGIARQRFQVDGRRVEPQILTTDDSRVRFAVNFTRPSTIRFKATPAERASYEIHLIEGALQRLLGRAEVATPTEVSHPLPRASGLLEFSSRGPLIWSDLRVVRDFRVWPHLAGLILLILLGRALRRAHPGPLFALSPARRLVVIQWSVGAGAMLAGLAAVELLLWASGDRLPASVQAQRRSLGIVAPDPRWEESARYGLRERPHQRTFCQWRYGDIVRMGFIPAEVSEGTEYRFRFETDAEGFRNPATRDRIQVAALGDSFTDALTVPIERAWTARLEQRLGVPVQNYGAAAFGPQQELRVLQDFALRHEPQVVIVAFFAGNDIFNAEQFERFERSGARPPEPGWKIKEVVARFDHLYTVSLLRAAADQLGQRQGWTSAGRAATRARDTDYSGENPKAPPVPSPRFDRGMFVLPVNGRTLRFALMPPYLNTLNLSRADLEARHGWELTRTALREMQEACRGRSAELIMMFIPFKSQVYLPLLERNFDRGQLEQALRFYFRDDATPVEVEFMSRNRLAQNDLMGRFCEQARIPFLDLTPVLQQEVEAGRNMYFPDDSHWNGPGHEAAAAALAEFLRQRGFHPAGS